MRYFFVSLLITCMVLTDVTGSFAEESANHVRTGIDGIFLPYTKAYQLYGEYERMLWRRFSLVFRLENLHYWYEHGAYEEEGDGAGAALGGRFYVFKREKLLLFCDGAIMGGQVDWEWTDDTGTPFKTKGDDSSHYFGFSTSFGGKFFFGKTNIYGAPVVRVGVLSNTNNASELNAPYGGIGLSLGYIW